MPESDNAFSLRDADQLRAQLADFSTPTQPLETPSAELGRYLDFYQLPQPSPALALYAGTLPDHADGNVVAMAWEPPQAIACALIVHGYLDHIGLFAPLIKHLLNQNMAVVCFDLPGHGLSSGEPAHIDTFDHYSHSLGNVVKLAQQLFSLPLHAVGQSTGGAVVLKHLLDTAGGDSGFASVNLLAPLLRPHLWGINRVVYQTTRRIRRSVGRNFRANSSDTEFLAFLRHKDPLQAMRIPMSWVGAMSDWMKAFDRYPKNDFPIRVIQGDRDSTLNWRHNLPKLRERFPRARIEIIPGAKHHLANESQPLRDRVFAALDFNAVEP